ncbi:hypothetical protein [Montanilutibacter psychrotolerans]|uniref:Uncharacterized protein n=1 Tax=Montanilutibacter psychrotolerans TaxID=1327343 RepID=A0A3M8ST29_9GAMM|nr:hypothetical protein [Lysobacter psychrotolerans]RNF84449.1 hypothetical protein EER27_08745 [Lysobacter psychrotolerans]
MKNNYRLEKLKKLELGPNESREAIYAMMLQPTLSGDFLQALDSLGDLEPHMTSDCYYVAHRLIASKGKKTVFKGELHKAERSDLLSFLDDAVTSGDLRELLISPVQENPNGSMIYISEDSIYLYAAG